MSWKYIVCIYVIIFSSGMMAQTPVSWGSPSVRDCDGSFVYTISGSTITMSDNEGSDCAPCQFRSNTTGECVGGSSEPCGNVTASSVKSIPIDISDAGTIELFYSISSEGGSDGLESEGCNSDDRVIIAYNDNGGAAGTLVQALGGFDGSSSNTIDVPCGTTFTVSVVGGTTAIDESYTVDVRYSLSGTKDAAPKVTSQSTSIGKSLDNPACVGEKTTITAEVENCDGCTYRWVHDETGDEYFGLEIEATLVENEGSPVNVFLLYLDNSVCSSDGIDVPATFQQVYIGNGNIALPSPLTTICLANQKIQEKINLRTALNSLPAGDILLDGVIMNEVSVADLTPGLKTFVISSENCMTEIPFDIEVIEPSETNIEEVSLSEGSIDLNSVFAETLLSGEWVDVVTQQPASIVTYDELTQYSTTFLYRYESAFGVESDDCKSYRIDIIKENNEIQQAPTFRDTSLCSNAEPFDLADLADDAVDGQFVLLNLEDTLRSQIIDPESYGNQFLVIEYIDINGPRDTFDLDIVEVQAPFYNPVLQVCPEADVLPAQEIMLELGQTINWYETPLAVNSISTNSIFTPETFGVFFFQIMNDQGCASAINSVEWVQTEQQRLEFSYSDFCEGSDPMIQTNILGGTFYLDKNDIGAQIDPATGAIDGPCGGTLGVGYKGTDPFGCTFDTLVSVYYACEPTFDIIDSSCDFQSNTYSLVLVSKGAEVLAVDLMVEQSGDTAFISRIPIALNASIILQDTAGQCSKPYDIPAIRCLPDEMVDFELVASQPICKDEISGSIEVEIFNNNANYEFVGVLSDEFGNLVESITSNSILMFSNLGTGSYSLNISSMETDSQYDVDILLETRSTLEQVAIIRDTNDEPCGQPITLSTEYSSPLYRILWNDTLEADQYTTTQDGQVKVEVFDSLMCRVQDLQYIQVSDTVPPRPNCNVLQNFDIADFSELVGTDLTVFTRDACDGRNIHYAITDSDITDLNRSEFDQYATYPIGCDDVRQGSKDIILHISDQTGNISSCMITINVGDRRNTCNLQVYNVQLGEVTNNLCVNDSSGSVALDVIEITTPIDAWVFHSVDGNLGKTRIDVGGTFFLGGLPEGDYTISLRQTNGTFIDNGIITFSITTESTLDSIQILSTSSDPDCGGQTLLSVEDKSDAWTIIWDDSIQQDELMAMPGSDHWVRVVDGFDCEAFDTISIAPFSYPQLTCEPELNVVLASQDTSIDSKLFLSDLSDPCFDSALFAVQPLSNQELTRMEIETGLYNDIKVDCPALDNSPLAVQLYSLIQDTILTCFSMLTVTDPSDLCNDIFVTTTIQYDEYCLNDRTAKLVVSSNFTDSLIVSWEHLTSQEQSSVRGISPVTIEGLASGEYRLTVEDLLGNRLYEEQIEILKASNLESVTIQVVDQSLSCEGPYELSTEYDGIGETILWNNTLNSPKITVPNPGQYTVEVIDNNGCVVRDTVDIISNTAPIIHSFNIYLGCYENDAMLTVTILNGNGPFTYSLSTVENHQNGIIVEQNGEVFADIGTGKYILEVKNQCETKRDTVDIPNFPMDLSMRVDTFLAMAGEPIVINTGYDPDFLDELTTITWMPSQGLNCTDCPDPAALLESSMLYTFIGDHPNGCSYAANVQVEIEDGTDPPDGGNPGGGQPPLDFDGFPFVAFPDVFQPSFDDASIMNYKENKKFRPLVHTDARGVYDMYVFDRWGSKLYSVEQVDIQNTIAGWKGDCLGLPCPRGVYTFKIRYYLEDGQNKDYLGTIMLLP